MKHMFLTCVFFIQKVAMKTLSPVFLSHVQRLTEDGSPSPDCRVWSVEETGQNPRAPLFCKHFLQGVQNLFLNSEGDNPESWW